MNDAKTMNAAGISSFTQGRENVISYPITAAGILTRVIEAGSGDKVIFCLHGAGSRADRWVAAMPGLVEEGYHLYAIDLPGHGFADKGNTSVYDGKRLAEFVAAVMDELGLTGTTLIGTSLGGYLGARVANTRPELVDRLVLVGAVGISTYSPEYHPEPSIVADGSLEGIRRKLNFLVADPEKVSDAWVKEESMINSSKGARESLLEIAIFLNEKINNDLQAPGLQERTFTQQPLIVWGDEDKWTPAQMAHEVHEELPGSELVIMEGCGHAPYFESPDKFVEIIAKYLTVGK